MGPLSEIPVPFCFGFVFPKPQYSPYTIRRMSKIEPSFLPLSVLGPSPPVKFSPILHGLRVFHSGDSHDDISTMFSHPETLQRPKQHSVVPFSYLHFVHRVTWLLQDLLGALIITLLICFWFWVSVSSRVKESFHIESHPQESGKVHAPVRGSILKTVTQIECPILGSKL